VETKAGKRRRRQDWQDPAFAPFPGSRPAAKRSDLGRDLRRGRTGGGIPFPGALFTLTGAMAGGRAASAVLPRSTLAIHVIGKMGMGIATVYGDARWAEAASFAAFAAAQQSSQRPPRSSGPFAARACALPL